jgi:hypothetical protein
MAVSRWNSRKTWYNRKEQREREVCKIKVRSSGQIAALSSPRFNGHQVRGRFFLKNICEPVSNLTIIHWRQPMNNTLLFRSAIRSQPSAAFPIPADLVIIRRLKNRIGSPQSFW